MQQGYKHTELGAIPESWGTVAFNKCFKILSNNTLSRAELSDEEGSVKNIHYGDILVKYDNVLNCATERISYIRDVNKTKNCMFLANGDLVIADTAEDETVGKAVEMINIGEQKVVSGLHTIPCRPTFPDMFADGWLGYYINHSIYHDQLLPFITGTKVSAISKSAIADTLILVPPMEEQERIAEALSDVDSMIASLEKLITKKKAVKQGAMQELLTGKKRLTGYTGKWKKIQLKELVKEFIVPMRDKPKDLSGPIPWCRIEDFNGKYLYSSKSNQGVTIETINNMNLKVFPQNTLLVSCSAYLGRCAIVKSELVTNQTFIGLVPGDNINVDFLFYVMNREEKNLNLLSSGTTISYLSREQFEEYKIYIPCEVSEQTAIASILSDMDNEIEALEQKLKKARQIKQGMMQQLLTGKIRLV